MLINGRVIDVTGLHDVFHLLEKLRAEMDLMYGLDALDLDGITLQQLVTVDLFAVEESGRYIHLTKRKWCQQNYTIFSDDKDEYSLDIRNPSVQFLNDVETDKRYSTFPASLRELLQPAFPGR